MALNAPKGYRKGKAMRLYKCIRDIRIMSPNTLGRIVDGTNSDGVYQKVMVIKESNPFNMEKTIVVELKPE